MKKLYFIWN